MNWSVAAVVCLLCAVVGSVAEETEQEMPRRGKRTIGFIFRGLVDAAANQAAVRYEQQRPQTTLRPIELTTPLPIERIRQPPRPMIYIIPVTNRSPHHNEISDLAEVLRHIKAPMKIKSENGTADPDLQELIHATKHMTIDKRNVPDNPDEETSDSELEETTEVPVKKSKKQFSIKFQAPKEQQNSQKQFTIRIEGDDVRVKKTKDGYAIKFSLPDSNANIRIEYPQQMFEKQELKPQQQQQLNSGQFFGSGPLSPFGGFQGLGGWGNPYGSPNSLGYPPTSAQQYPGTPGQDIDPNQANNPAYAYAGGQPYPSQYPGADPYKTYASGYADPYNYNSVGNGVANQQQAHLNPYQQYGFPGGLFSQYRGGAGGASQGYDPNLYGLSRQGQAPPSNGQYEQASSQHTLCVVHPDDASSYGSNNNCTQTY